MRQAGPLNEILVLDNETAREIMQELYRLFQIHTEHIHLHGSHMAVNILIFPRRGQQFELPEGEQNWSMKADKFEILGRGRHG